MPPFDRPMLIAIDGPAGAGKSTLAEALALELGLPHLNTGLMYRAVAERAILAGVDPDDGAGLADVARGIRFSMAGAPIPELTIDGAPAGPSLRSDVVEAVVSRVARHPSVRDILRRAQRDLGGDRCVMEGRDIGTVVLPHADVKIFLAAEPGVRASRRAKERGLRTRAGVDGMAAAVAGRDAADDRTNPLVPAPDAHLLDSTSLDPEALMAAALDLVHRTGGGRP